MDSLTHKKKLHCLFFLRIHLEVLEANIDNECDRYLNFEIKKLPPLK